MRGILAALVLLAAGSSVRSQPDAAPPPVYPGPSPSASPSPSPGPAPSASWLTRDHSPGMCATYGTCGHRHDGDPLPCAANVPAAPPGEALATALQAVCPGLWADAGGPAGRYCCTADQVQRISSDTAKAMPFIVGCPACRRNFIQLWCVTTCSPDQATFANVTAVQTAFDTASTDAVAELEYWVSEQYSTQLYDSCKDVKFGAANVPAMSFIGGGATSGQAWLDFLGTLKDKRFPPIGSPIQINFRPENATPPGLSPLVDRVVACGDNAFRCSCSDCPAAQGCAQPAPEPPAPPPACHVGSLRCLTFTLIWVYAATAACVLAGYALGSGGGGFGRATAGRGAAGAVGVGAEAEAQAEAGGSKERAARSAAPAGWEQDEFGDVSGGARLGQPLLARAAATADGGGATAGGHRPPLMERLLQRGYYRLGLFVGTYPVAVAALGLGLVGLCCLGLLRFRVETDPQRLWVGPESQAAQEKAAYEASFGPFYRVEQMILATQPSLPPSPPLSTPAAALDQQRAANSSAGAQPILADAARLELLFDMQQLVDELEAPLPLPDGGQGVVRLRDVCFKPFGDECATQSVLQYWRLNRTLYRTEQARPAGSPGRMTPEYCFTHWFTECRSAFQAPIDPHVVLGGFPAGDQFTTYTAGATSFVTTYPVSSEPQLRAAAAAWEAAFVALAQGRLSDMAAAAGLSLSFSTERSVQDELTRESRADAGTVAASYGIMLLYIAAALGSFPPPWSVWWAARGRGLEAAVVWLRRGALTSRAGLGLAGVAIVALSVAGALGLVSAAGLWCTLIIMEVIPFLVLAVGVDNMFVLAHAMAKQDHALPPAERLALSLAAAGPSITLAAACETAAFALGGALTSMPAVRNFSLAAAAAVALDFGLQVTVFAALLVLDVRRLQSRRLDCLPCLQLQPEQLQPGGSSAAAAARRRRRGGGSPYRAAGTAMVMERHYGGAKDVLDEDELYEYAAAAASEYGNEEDRPPYIGPSSDGEVDEHSYWSLQRVLQAYFERVHAPLLCRPAAQAAVLLAFAASTCVCLALLPRLQVGLDQAVALPRDSYLQPYYRDVLAQLRVGPPLLLVVEDLDLDPAARQVEALCGVAGCAADSLVNRVSAAARDPGRTYIAAAAASWLDDFMSWLSPDLPACCRSRSADALHGDAPEGGSVHLGASAAFTSQSQFQSQSLAASFFTAGAAAGAYCPPPDQPPCSTNASACAGCRTCVQAAFEGGRPSVPQFQAYLPWFLAAKPSEGCAKGGVGAYSSSLQRADITDPTSVAGLLPEGGAGGGRVAASSFRTYYRPLRQQSDFIEAMRQSRAFAAAASRELGLRIYSYSLFHVFFEQYLGVAGDAVRMVGLPLLAVVGVAWGLGGSLAGAALLAAVLGSLLLHLGGAMVLAGIQVNAVSLVNLAMALGIAVEFCAHVLHAYMVAVVPLEPLERPGARPGVQQQQQDGGRQGQGQAQGQEEAVQGPAGGGIGGVWSRLLARPRGGGGGGGGYAPLPAADADGQGAQGSGGDGGGGGGGVWRLGFLGGHQRAARSRAALVSVGASVLSGVTLTKLVGVAVLAFARTQIFEIYYFRLYAALVVAGAAHGLVLLPVLLALAGPTAVF